MLNCCHCTLLAASSKQPRPENVVVNSQLKPISLCVTQSVPQAALAFFKNLWGKD